MLVLDAIESRYFTFFFQFRLQLVTGKKGRIRNKEQPGRESSSTQALVWNKDSSPLLPSLSEQSKER